MAAACVNWPEDQLAAFLRDIQQRSSDVMDMLVNACPSRTLRIRVWYRTLPRRPGQHSRNAYASMISSLPNCVMVVSVRSDRLVKEGIIDSSWRQHESKVPQNISVILHAWRLHFLLSP